jgi:hypothetical protein
MIQDPIKAIIDILKANAAVTTLVGTRVFGLELPRPEAASMPRKAIVIQASGGGVFRVGSSDYIKHSDQRIDIFSYGETPFEAQKVRREVVDVLKQAKRQVINGTLIQWINRAGGSLALRDPDTDWPVCFESFQLFFAETAVA